MSETGLLPAYLIVGTDGVKRDHAVSRMKARLEKSGMVEFNLDERDMTKDPDIESIIGSLNTFPMGSEFRLVILDGCSKLAKAVSEPLVGYLASPSPTTVCLIIADSLAKNTRLYKAIAKIDKKAIVDCSGTKRWELPRRVQQMATQRGKSISTAAAEELVSRSGENTRMLDNDLAKLAQMVESPQIELADVERWIVRTAEVNHGTSSTPSRLAICGVRSSSLSSCPPRATCGLTHCCAVAFASLSSPRRSTRVGRVASWPQRSSSSPGRSRIT